MFTLMRSRSIDKSFIFIRGGRRDRGKGKEKESEGLGAGGELPIKIELNTAQYAFSLLSMEKCIFHSNQIRILNHKATR